MKFTKILFLLLFACKVCLFAQNKQFLSYFKNPSFEGKPMSSELPSPWLSCGEASESNPDTQPGSFKVTQKAQDGNAYIGMIVRDNLTHESITQKLKTPLLKGKTYYLSVWLARSEQYVSLSATTNKTENFNTPCILKIWLGNKTCARTTLIATSKLIENTDWKEFIFTFTPSENMKSIIFEACHESPEANRYNGNLLLDNLSLYTQDN
jgi:hypothetical protein